MDAINYLTTISEFKNPPENTHLITTPFVLDDLVPLEINHSDNVALTSPETQTSETLETIDSDDTSRKEHVLLSDFDSTAVFDVEQNMLPKEHQNIPTSENILDNHQMEQEAPDAIQMVSFLEADIVSLNFMPADANNQIINQEISLENKVLPFPDQVSFFHGTRSEIHQALNDFNQAKPLQPMATEPTNVELTQQEQSATQTSQENHVHLQSKAIVADEKTNQNSSGLNALPKHNLITKEVLSEALNPSFSEKTFISTPESLMSFDKTMRQAETEHQIPVVEDKIIDIKPSPKELVQTSLQTFLDKIDFGAIGQKTTPSNAPLKQNHTDFMEAPGHQVTFSDVKKTLQSGESIQEYTARIKIYPPELGEIQAKIFMRQGQASLSMTTDDSHVKQLVEANIHKLKDGFNEANLNLVDVDVSDKHGSQKQKWSHEKKTPYQAQNNHPDDVGDATQHGNTKVISHSLVDIYA